MPFTHVGLLLALSFVVNQVEGGACQSQLAPSAIDEISLNAAMTLAVQNAKKSRDVTNMPQTFLEGDSTPEKLELDAYVEIALRLQDRKSVV